MPGPVHGIRAWRVKLDESGRICLTGLNGTPWCPDGKSTAARCCVKRHRAPAGSCDCGLYAVHPWVASGWEQALLHARPEEGCVVGIAEAWGRLQLHDDGFRAQYARPLALGAIAAPRSTERTELVDLVARIYVADVVEVADLAGLEGYCREREVGMSRSAVDSLLFEPSDANSSGDR
jgi:hypothetical protein